MYLETKNLKLLVSIKRHSRLHRLILLYTRGRLGHSAWDEIRALCLKYAPIMPPILTSYSKIGTGSVSNGSSRARRKAFPPYAQTLLYHTTLTKDEIFSPKSIKATFVKQSFSKFPWQECLYPFCYSHLLSHLNHQDIASSRTTFTLLFQAPLRILVDDCHYYPQPPVTQHPFKLFTKNLWVQLALSRVCVLLQQSILLR